MIARHLAEDFVARPQLANELADVLDPSCDVGAENRATGCSRSANASVSWFSDQPFPVGSIDRRSNDPDENLVIGGSGLRHLLDPHHIRRTVLRANDRPHAVNVVAVSAAYVRARAAGLPLLRVPDRQPPVRRLPPDQVQSAHRLFCPADGLATRARVDASDVAAATPGVEAVADACL